MADDGHGGKISGKVKDRLPVIPDHVAEALDKGVDVPMEAFRPGAAKEHLQDRIARRSEPVHAENLTPVSRNDPRIADFGKMDGARLPKMPAMRRVIPAPFQRPAAVMRQDHGRSWQMLRADQVAVGDTVVEFGLVTSAEQSIEYTTAEAFFSHGYIPANLTPDSRIALGEVVVLTNPVGTRRAYAPTATVRVFARTPDGA